MNTLTEEQKNVIQAIKDKHNVLLLGFGGVGKSYLVKTIKKTFDNVAVTATTGVSAVNVKGMTIHSWAGIALGDKTVDYYVNNLHTNIEVRLRWQKTSILIIDEMSMMSRELLDLLDGIGRRVRDNDDEPFGGIQLIFLADFFQLPPVKATEYCFESEYWKDYMFVTIELTKSFRQTDPAFVDVLNRIRVGTVDDEVVSIIRSRMIKPEPIIRGNLRILPTILNSRRDITKKINHDRLIELSNIQVFPIKVSYEQCTRMVNDTTVKKCMQNLQCEEEFECAVGAQVMLTKNLNVLDGLANGSRGVVKAIDRNNETITVLFTNGQECPIERAKWSVVINTNSQIVFQQYPLLLAWSITIHKSQGMSIDFLEVNIGESIFEYGQAYTALSRARSLEGLFVSAFEPNSIRANPKVKHFYEKNVS